jgi:uracil-DNA glycosylase
MRADLGALLEHHDLEIGRKLLEADRGGEPGGAGAGDHHVDRHGFALDFLGAHPWWLSGIGMPAGLIRRVRQVKTRGTGMDRGAPPSLTESIAAAQAWWREAGVDLLFHDAPQAWLADETPAAEGPAPKAAETPAPPPRPRIGGDPGTYPQDLAAFRRWWLEAPSLDAGGINPRLAPRGEAGAAVMMLVPMPEADDRETLLSGKEGVLLASLATAMGLEPGQAYLAAALPRHTPLPDWERLGAEGLGDVLLQHIALAAPQRLIVLGTRILPLLGHDPAQAAPGVSELAIQGRHLPVLASYAPERLLGNARQRAALWRAWLDWTDEGSG